MVASKCKQPQVETEYKFVMNCEPMFKEGYYMYSMPNQIFEHTIEPKINASCADTDFSPRGGLSKS